MYVSIKINQLIKLDRLKSTLIENGPILIKNFNQNQALIEIRFCCVDFQLDNNPHPIWLTESESLRQN